jgi:hypothetical protein
MRIPRQQYLSVHNFYEQSISNIKPLLQGDLQKGLDRRKHATHA